MFLQVCHILYRIITDSQEVICVALLIQVHAKISFLINILQSHIINKNHIVLIYFLESQVYTRFIFSASVEPIAIRMTLTLSKPSDLLISRELGHALHRRRGHRGWSTTTTTRSRGAVSLPEILGRGSHTGSPFCVIKSHDKT